MIGRREPLAGAATRLHISGTTAKRGTCAPLGRLARQAESAAGPVPGRSRPAGDRAAKPISERLCDVFDIYTIIFLALAVFIFIRLRSVLGQRTGRERPPIDPYAPRPPREAARPPADNVVTLPGNGQRTEAPRPAEPVASDRWKGIAEPGTPLAAGLDSIRRGDPAFDPAHFLAGAKAAYEMIVTAYAEGDRATLRNLLSKDVYDGFDAAIREREARGEEVETRFVGIEKADLVGAEVRGGAAHVTVRFVSQLVSVTRSRDGTVVDGSPDAVTDVTDVWTFSRDLSSRDPNWKLVATEAGQ